jgi:hypothetical protein
LRWIVGAAGDDNRIEAGKQSLQAFNGERFVIDQISAKWDSLP